MNRFRVKSDHLNKWSDIYEERIYQFSTEKTKSVGSTTAIYAGHPPRIVDQTLQKMWKARLSVCSRTWAWPQILPFSQPGQRKTTDRLCSAGLLRTSRKVSGQLSNYQGNPQGNLRYQLRTSAPPGAIIGNRDVFLCDRKYRYRRNSHIGCQYDRRISKSHTGRNLKHGGQL